MEIIALVEGTELPVRATLRQLAIPKSTFYGWYRRLSTVPDDFSRYIIAWKLGSTMGATDVKDTLDHAIAMTGVDQIRVKHRPRRRRTVFWK